LADCRQYCVFASDGSCRYLFLPLFVIVSSVCIWLNTFPFNQHKESKKSEKKKKERGQGEIASNVQGHYFLQSGLVH
jgi:hypothetical protein